METDASDGVIAEVLFQKYGDDWHSVAYFSKTMASAETNYSIHDKEMLAIVQTIEEWWLELVGLQIELSFEVLSNHKALKYFMTIKKLNSWQANWAETLAQFKFIIWYHSGCINSLVDALFWRKNVLKAQQAAQDNFHQQVLLPRNV